jgi:hypothetical protein
MFKPISGCRISAGGFSPTRNPTPSSGECMQMMLVHRSCSTTNGMLVARECARKAGGTPTGFGCICRRYGRAMGSVGRHRALLHIVRQTVRDGHQPDENPRSPPLAPRAPKPPVVESSPENVLPTKKASLKLAEPSASAVPIRRRAQTRRVGHGTADEQPCATSLLVHAPSSESNPERSRAPSPRPVRRLRQPFLRRVAISGRERQPDQTVSNCLAGR